MGKWPFLVFVSDLPKFVAGVGLRTHVKTSNKLALWEVDTFAHSLDNWLCEFDYTELKQRRYNRVQLNKKVAFEWHFKAWKWPLMWLINVRFAAWWGSMRQPCFFTDCPANVQPGNLTRKQWENEWQSCLVTCIVLNFPIFFLVSQLGLEACSVLHLLMFTAFFFSFWWYLIILDKHFYTKVFPHVAKGLVVGFF